MTKKTKTTKTLIIRQSILLLELTLYFNSQALFTIYSFSKKRLTIKDYHPHSYSPIFSPAYLSYGENEQFDFSGFQYHFFANPLYQYDLSNNIHSHNQNKKKVHHINH